MHSDDVGQGDEPILRVYVSSTLLDLRSERDAVFKWLTDLGHLPRHSYVGDSETVQYSCLRDVEQCDIYILILGHLLGLAREMREVQIRGESLGLTEDEVAFYDALEANDSAVKMLGDANLRLIAQELVKTVRANAGIDWQIREDVRAKLRVAVKRILRRYGYPPDKQERATQLVLEQAEALSEGWA